MCIPCGLTFHRVPYFLTLWPWPWSLTYFWKTLTVDITLKPDEIGLSYCTCVFLTTITFTWYHSFDLVTLTLKFDLLVSNFNLLLFNDGCRPASVVVIWQLLFILLLNHDMVIDRNFIPDIKYLQMYIGKALYKFGLL